MSNKKFDFEKDFELFRQNVISLCVEWDFYTSLYSNEKNVSILNKSASFFFSRLQIMLIDAITLKIGNLLDKKDIGKDTNLSFSYLFDNIPLEKIYFSESKYYASSYHDGKFLATKYSCIYRIQSNTHCGFLVKVKYWSSCNTLEQQLEDLKDKFKPLKKYRNKNLGHFDLKTAQNNTSYMPPDVFNVILDIVSLIDRLMNRIEVYYKDSSTSYEPIIHKGANHLLSDLLRAMRYKELLKDGSIDNLDFVKNIDRLKNL